MQPTRPAVARLCSLAFAAALLPGLAFAQEDVTADTVLATVNGTEITAGHLILLRAQLPEQYQQMPNDALYAPLLQQAIQQILLSQTVEDVGTAGQLALDNQERALRANVAMRRLSETAVTEDSLQAAYDELYAAAEPGREFRAAHILVETEERAGELRREIEGGADFSAMAREHSTGPSGPNGGDLGWFGIGMMVPEFEAAVMELEPGQVSQPVQTQFGWHLVRLEETRLAAVPSLAEVQDEIAENLRQEAISAQLAELEAGAEIERTASESLVIDFLSDPALVEN